MKKSSLIFFKDKRKKLKCCLLHFFFFFCALRDNLSFIIITLVRNHKFRIFHTEQGLHYEGGIK